MGIEYDASYPIPIAAPVELFGDLRYCRAIAIWNRSSAVIK
jgi:hypothetical protein